MTVDGAEVVLIWSDGRKTRLGTLDISAETEDKVHMRMRFLRQKIGWEMVRKGFWLMFPWKKWSVGENEISNSQKANTSQRETVRKA